MKRAAALLAVVMIAGCAGTPPASVPDAGPPVERQQVERGPTQGAGDDVAPNAADLHYAAALDLLRRGNYADAALALGAMTRAYPELAGPWLNLGIIHARTGRNDEAERALRTALDRNPQSAVAYNLLGLLYRETGRFEEARRAYESALEIDGDYADAHLNLAILNDLYLQRLQPALTHYERYRQLDGQDDAMVERWIIDLRQRLAQESEGVSGAVAQERGFEGGRP